MGWYKFSSQEEFNLWHEEVKKKLGLPKLSIDSDGNEVEPLIEEYTKLIFEEDRLIAYSDDEHANGLFETRPPNPIRI